MAWTDIATKNSGVTTQVASNSRPDKKEKPHPFDYSFAKAAKPSVFSKAAPEPIERSGFFGNWLNNRDGDEYTSFA